MQKYKCGMCDSEFALPRHCERHMTAALSGFCHICSSCGLVFTRKDSKHGCMNYFSQIVKRSTCTLTWEEAVEFENFQKSRSKFCIPFMKSLPSSNYNLFNKSAKRAIFYRIHDPQKEKEVFSKSSAASDTDSCPWGFGTSKTKHSSIILGRYGCATYVFFLLFPSKWANSRWLDLQASWPTWISPWTPSNMWRQAGRFQSSRKLSPGYPSKWINGTETGWWDLSTNWRQNWSRWNNQHLQIEPTQRCSQATKTLSSETPSPAVDKKAVKMLSSCDPYCWWNIISNNKDHSPGGSFFHFSVHRINLQAWTIRQRTLTSSLTETRSITDSFLTICETTARSSLPRFHAMFPIRSEANFQDLEELIGTLEENDFSKSCARPRTISNSMWISLKTLWIIQGLVNP